METGSIPHSLPAPMLPLRSSARSSAARLLPWGMLAFLLAFTYARFAVIPYVGFDWSSDGTVNTVHLTAPGGEDLRLGDRLLQVGNMSWEDFGADLAAPIFAGARPGDEIGILVERGGQPVSVMWKLPGPNAAEAEDRFFSTVWLAYFFWLLGTACLFHVRPRGLIWRLGVACNYLTAAWVLLLGDLSGSHVWYSAYVLRFAIWLCAAAYLHFHWQWPRVPVQLPRAMSFALYGAAASIATAECLGLLPQLAHLWGLALMFAGSMLLLFMHLIRDRGIRPLLRRVLLILGIGLLPLGAIPLLERILPPNRSVFLGLLGLTAGIFGYFSTIFRNLLGDLGWRVNRVFALYLFVMVAGLLLATVLILGAPHVATPGAGLIIGAVVGAFVAAGTTLGYPAFRTFVERRLLGLPVASDKLLTTYAAQATAVSSVEELASLISDEILPSLFIRDFAFINFDGDDTRTVLAKGHGQASILHSQTLQHVLTEIADRDMGRIPEGYPQDRWIRLVIPLRINDALGGVWLLGARDSDDVYSPAQVRLIRALAHQTALALGHIIQAQHLRSLYQEHIARQEQERVRLALKLHDNLLNYIAATLLKLQPGSLTPEVQESFLTLLDRLRDIATDLRPPMLTYGLEPAIKDLTDRRALLGPGAAKLTSVFETVDASIRYPADVELHLFRIVQEAVENALKHAHAVSISINGRLSGDTIEVSVQDDGMGFEVPDRSQLQSLIARKHFGLAGLIERATLVGGKVHIASAPDRGTTIRIHWQAKPQQTT